ncbi:MAG: DUF4920 domain-containing protein [Proteobacteria bacterium]|nr:DUF4920 domain-containing protein [Pseudomonadota bacterium]MBU1057767.1 DUF4920 domain-containing protein [Pseudomonadota bacterium]
MMKKHSLFLLVLFLLSVTTCFAAMQLGEPLTLEEVTKVSEINQHPDQYTGKRVLIEGLIINVCAARGCWMDIASDVPFEKIQVKVVDGEIVFPLEAKGQMARVEGIVEALHLTEDQARSLAEHQAKESGGQVDLTSIKGPSTYYRIRGLGAEID